MSKSFRDRNPYLIGLSSVAAILTVVTFAFLAGLLHLFDHTYTMRGVFSDAAGIQGGDAVRVAGVKVGRVASVEADRLAGNVKVRWGVNHGVHLGPDTRAEIALETLLGAKYVRLSGPVVKPYIESRPETKRLIPIERTKIPFDIFALFKLSTQNIEATDTTRLNELINQLADVTQGKHDQISQLLQGISQLSGALNERDAQLRQLLDRADQLSATLADKDKTLVALIDQSQGILNFVVQRRQAIASSLSAGNAAVNDLASVIDRNKTVIDGLLSSLHPTITLLDQHQPDLQKALAWTGPAIVGQAAAGTHGPWADIYVQNIGPNLVGTLCGVAKQVNPAATC